MQERAHQIYEEAHRFYGASGQWYDYHLPRDLNTIPVEAGNYILATWRDNEWWVLYVGESENLRDRLANNRHEKMGASILLASPDLVYTLYDANGWDKDRRRKAEKDLIDSEESPLNY